jgi:hypothetical protein
MDVRFYLSCFRTEALIASQLEPEKFGAYMAVGTRKLIHGIVMFFEIDPSLVSDAIDLDAARERCQPRSDGSPKRSKYVSIYRVLEHIPLEALGKLHLVTRDGRDLILDPDPNYQDPPTTPDSVHLYAELCPVSPRVVASLPPAAFADYLTNPENPVCVPRVFFAEQILDFDDDGSLASYLPYRPAQHITDCIDELRESSKATKTADRNPPLSAFYRTIKPGFFVGDQTGIKFYPFPDQQELDAKRHIWWKSASLG